MPDGGHVFIDGIDTGQTTPMELKKIVPGKHIFTVSAPGWTTDSRTVNVLDLDANGHHRDTHLSFNLLPVLTVGPKGDKGDQGVSGAPSFIPGPAGQSIVGQTGLQGVPGQNGTNGLPGTPGANGTDGLPGRASFQGVWSISSTYQPGDEILRPAGYGSPGPFWNITGNNGGDPATDGKDWVYCCGTPVLGYQALIMTASGYNGDPVPVGFSKTLISNSYAPETVATYSQLTVIVNSIATIPTPAQFVACIGNPFGLGHGFSLCANVNSISYTSEGFNNSTGRWEVQGCGGIAGFDSNGDPFYDCTTVAASAPPVGNLTFTVLKNGVPTGMTVTVGAPGIFTSPVSITSFGAGDTFALVLANPSSVTDDLNANFNVQ